MKKILLLLSIFITSTLYGEGIVSVDLMNGKVILQGKNESCKITMNVMAIIKRTNCKRLTNSKGVKIVCTRRKSMCKTELEVDNYIYRDMSLHLKKKTRFKKLPDLKDMPYYKARKIILQAGYKPKINSNPPQFGQAKTLYKHGYKEVDDCSSISIMPCRFEFYASGNKKLIVSTYTQEPDELNLFVTSSYFE